MRLADLSYRSGRLEYRSWRVTEPEGAILGYLEEARRILANPASAADPDCLHELAPELECLRWFPLPGEFEKA